MSKLSDFEKAVLQIIASMLSGAALSSENWPDAIEIAEKAKSYAIVAIEAIKE